MMGRPITEQGSSTLMQGSELLEVGLSGKNNRISINYLMELQDGIQTQMGRFHEPLDSNYRCIATSQ